MGQWGPHRWMTATTEPVVDPTPVTTQPTPDNVPEPSVPETTSPAPGTDQVTPDFTEALHSVATARAYLEQHPDQAEELGRVEAAGKGRKMIAEAVADVIADRA